MLCCTLLLMGGIWVEAFSGAGRKEFKTASLVIPL
jgi:hypothetical protein